MARSTLALTPKVDKVDDVLAAHVNTLQTNQEKIWNTLAFVEATELTIAAGVITVTSNYHTVDTAGDIASDDLDTITISGNIGEGSILVIRPDHTDRTVIIKHNTGNILCNGNMDITLDDSHDFAFLVYDETLVKWMAFGAVSTPISSSVCNGRLTLETGVAVSTADQADKTNLYFTPYKGDEVSLYDGTNWIRHEFAALTLAVGAFTASKPHDIFLYSAAGVPRLSETEWTNATTRATALTTVDGVLVKAGANGYRYLGTIYIDAAQKCQDLPGARYVWNYYNRVDRPIYAHDATANWPYTTATIRAANGDTTNGSGRVSIVIGVSESLVELEHKKAANNTSGSVGRSCGIGLDSTAAYVAGSLCGYSMGGINQYIPLASKYSDITAIGFHYLQALEYSAAAGTTTWLSTSTIYNYGMRGFINC